MVCKKNLPAYLGGNMIFFNWENNYETGFELIDKQHKDYIIIVDQLQNSIVSHNKELFNKYSVEFLTHIHDHFVTENDLMIKHNYHGYFSHKAEHDRFYEKTKNNLANLYDKSTIEINLFFEVTYRWFRNHLDINDRKLARFLIDNNLS